MNNSYHNARTSQPQTRSEALPLPTRGAPRTLLSVMFVALTLAMVASQALPRILVA